MPTFGRVSDSIAVNPTVDRFTATASQTVFTLYATPSSQTLVWVNGVLQEPTTHYTISGRTLTLGTACTVGDKVAAEYGTGGAAVSYATPTVRGARLTYFNGSSVNALLPTGTVAGDTLFIFAGQGYTPTTPSGATVIMPSANNSQVVYWKVANGTDITNGYIVSAWSNSYTGTVGIVSVIGANASPVRDAFKTLWWNSVSPAHRQTTGALVASTVATPGDLFLAAGWARSDQGGVAVTITPSVGTLLVQSTTDAASSMAISWARITEATRPSAVFSVDPALDAGGSMAGITVKA